MRWPQRSPTAFFMAAALLDDGKIIGHLPAAGGEQEQFGLVLDKASPRTTCVGEAVDALRAHRDGLRPRHRRPAASDPGSPSERPTL